MIKIWVKILMDWIDGTHFRAEFLNYVRFLQIRERLFSYLCALKYSKGIRINILIISLLIFQSYEHNNIYH
jgi:hypothetical protein